MFDAKSITEIERLAKHGELARRIVPAPQEPKHVYYVAEGEGESLKLVKTTATPSPIRDLAADLPSLTAWLAAGDKQASGEIWYSRNSVVASPGDAGDDQANTCTLKLFASPQLAFLCEVAKDSGGRKFTQTQFIRALRTTLFGAYGGDLLAAARKVQLQKAKDVVAQQTMGKVSLNRSDVAEMSGATDIPDVVSFDVLVFSAASIPARCSVQCDLDLDADSEVFVLTVLPGEIERAFAKGESWLATTLDELLGAKSSVATYLGAPGCA